MNKRQRAMKGNEKLTSYSKIENEVRWMVALGSPLVAECGGATDKQKVGQ